MQASSNLLSFGTHTYINNTLNLIFTRVKIHSNATAQLPVESLSPRFSNDQPLSSTFGHASIAEDDTM